MMRNLSIILCFVLVPVLMVTAGQSVWAEAPQGQTCETFIEGAITEVLVEDNAIVVDGGYTVYGIPLNYLENWFSIVLEAGDNVVINAHDCPTTGKLVACDLLIDEGFFDLRQRKNKPGESQFRKGPGYEHSQ